MAAIYSDLEDIAARLSDMMGDKRTLVAIAGPPGVGKSTFAAALKERLNERHPESCAILPMDGYHYDDLYLDEKGWRSRKGAPHTFDVGGLRHMLGRLKRNEEASIAIPVFDRKIEIARAAADEILSSIKMMLVEGNYLLLKEPPWDSISSYFHMSIMLQSSSEVLRKRLTQRWKKFGYDPQQISEKMNLNDLPNVQIVISASSTANYVVSTDKILTI